ncbi:uncharacterized protein LOC123504336 isoform X1 [Portunus trituberculatus]|uniref:uncharacterized protein LOC123504336 isoform X1 n=1 Tax=Portunus trituberculatus TaxID=210409 RepID=UPI001E1CEE16|nr:uncharacterized protein LOC123504336 isoform X1 [Portunus trituberculatus]
MLVVTPHRSRRREERRVADAASRREGETEEGGGKARVQNYSYITKFGWVFPRTKSRRQGVVDAVWLREFSQDISTLQSEIRKQAVFAYGDEKPRHSKDSLRTECDSECCGASMSNCKERVSVPEMATSSRVAMNSSVHTRSLESSHDSCGEGSGGGGNTRACSSSQGLNKVKVQVLVHEEESSRNEKPFVLDSRFNTYTVGAKCDEYSSMQSDISRDSGIYSTDDSSLVSEASGDKSLLQELGDVLGDQDVSLEACIHCGSLPIEDIITASKENASRPVWLARFSSTNDLSTEWGSQEWEVGQSPEMSPLRCLTPMERRNHCALEDSDSHDTPPASAGDVEEGLKVNQCMNCEKLNEESPLNISPSQHVSELAKFTHSFQVLSMRLEDLRLGMECLAGEVNESKSDFISLEKRAGQVMTSTANSRQQLTRVRALQLLEDRLQEEWWAAYDPTSVSCHENYIV